jgi:hypothetical protein
MTDDPKDETHSEDEAVARPEAALKKMPGKPHRPHKPTGLTPPRTKKPKPAKHN